MRGYGLTSLPRTSRGFKEVLIDQYTHRVGNLFKLSFKENPDMLMDVIEESQVQGTTVLLEAVQGEIPLVKYRRDTIEARINLTQSIDGGAIGYLGTKIPSVRLKLWYQKESRLPQLSFTVDDITQSW